MDGPGRLYVPAVIVSCGPRAKHAFGHSGDWTAAAHGLLTPLGIQQGRQFEDLEVTVDTVSTFTAVPRALLQRLGVPVRRSARSRLPDGSSVPVDIGWTVVRLEDQTFATQVIFAEENQPSLLGVVTLEDALLAVDPVGQRLVPVEAERL